MLFTLNPGNVSTADVSVPPAAAASLTVAYEPQPVPNWANATEVKNNSPQQHLIYGTV